LKVHDSSLNEEKKTNITINTLVLSLIKKSSMHATNLNKSFGTLFSNYL